MIGQARQSSQTPARNLRQCSHTSSPPDAPVARYEQTLTIPQFLDTKKISASHRHGLLQLTLPLKESVKPRRVES